MVKCTKVGKLLRGICVTMNTITCPICGQTEFNGPGDHCFVCNWECDLVQHDNPDEDGANVLSVNEYRKAWVHKNIVSRTRQKVLKNKIDEMENDLSGKKNSDVKAVLQKQDFPGLLEEAMKLKELSTQVDTAIHAYGILTALPKILEGNEIIESLSLGAGNRKGDFDLRTSKRIAEFKFALWDDGSNTIRQNNIFTNFLELAINEKYNNREKYLYCLSYADVIKFLSTSNRNLISVLSKNSIGKKYAEHSYRYKTVKAFYDAHKGIVKIEDLNKYINI